jgi:hypothetical protein
VCLEPGILSETEQRQTLFAQLSRARDLVRPRLWLREQRILEGHVVLTAIGTSWAFAVSGV